MRTKRWGILRSKGSSIFSLATNYRPRSYGGTQSSTSTRWPTPMAGMPVTTAAPSKCRMLTPTAPGTRPATPTRDTVSPQLLDIRRLGEAIKVDTGQNIDYMIDFHSTVNPSTPYHHGLILPAWQSDPFLAVADGVGAIRAYGKCCAR